MAEDTTGTTAPAAPAAAPATGTTEPVIPAGMGDAGKKALQEERAARGEAEKAAAEARRQFDQVAVELQQFRDRDKTEAEKLTDRATTAEKAAAEAATSLLKYQVAAEKNLPAQLAARLQGATKDDLLKDADNLLTLLATQQQAAAPSFDGGVRTTATAPIDMNTLIRQKAGYQ